MDIDLTKVSYKDLNSKQKENYNYHKVASALAEYGYDSMRLNNDWEGADFISVKGDDMIKVQLKSRFTISKKYSNKKIWIAFIENGIVYLYDHDLIVENLTDTTRKSKSWSVNKNYSQMPVPKVYIDLMIVL